MNKKSGMKGKSSPQGTAVGSGSRPMGGKINIPTSAPKDKHGLDTRKVKGALGQGGKMKSDY